MKSLSTSARDRQGRPWGALRLSVTDRCNLRCDYCMPRATYQWLPRSDLLSFEEIGRLLPAFVAMGVRKIRLTGGEPLLRHDLAELVALLSSAGLDEIAMTSNGVRLQRQARALAAAGLQRVTLSLDTLRRQRFIDLTGRDALTEVLCGIEGAEEAGLAPVKLNTVVMRGVNDDEIIDILRFAAARKAEARFIEYMDVAGATGWQAGSVVTKAEILARIARELGPVEPVARAADDSAPAARFRLPDGNVFGIIASTTEPFCGACDRGRVTADGLLFLCLYATAGIDLRTPLRAGASAEDLIALLRAAWVARDDQSARERVGLASRGPAADVVQLRYNPHLEMHTRGG